MARLLTEQYPLRRAGSESSEAAVLVVCLAVWQTARVPRGTWQATHLRRGLRGRLTPEGLPRQKWKPVSTSSRSLSPIWSGR
jgi:hypothetical protein